MYYVYILQSEKDATKYIGVTENLKMRLQDHNQGKVSYSKSKRPFKVIWYCAFIQKEKARNFEKYLKSSSGYAFRNKRLI